MAEHEPSVVSGGMPADLAALREILVGPERAQLTAVSARLDQVQQQLGSLPETLRPEISALVTACLREAIAATPELESVRLNERAGRALRRARRVAAAAGVTMVLAIAGATLLLSGRNSQALDQQIHQDAARLRAAVAESQQQTAARERELLGQVSRLEQQTQDAKVEAKRGRLELAKAELAQKQAQADLLTLQTQLRGSQSGTEGAEAKTAELTRALERAAKGREELLKELGTAQRSAKLAQAQVETLRTQAGDAARQVADLEERAARLQNELSKARAQPERVRYALATGYDAALDFLHAQFGDVTTTPAAEGTALMGQRLEGSSALTIRVEKRKVLWAELALALAPDVPAGVLADNKSLLHAFAGEFAPTWGEPDAWLLAAAERAGKLGTKERLVRAAEAFKVTVGRSAAGATVVRIEPLQNDLEDE